MPDFEPAAPPVAKQVPHARTLHGETVDDPWSWMRVRDDPDVLAYLEAENAHTDAVLAGTVVLQAQVFDEIKTRWQETDLSAPAPKGGWWYYTRTVEGLQYPIHCRRRNRDEPEGGPSTEQVLLDENLRADGHAYYATSGVHVSQDARLMAWGEDTDGSEVYRLRFRDLESGTDLADEISRTYYGGAWAADGRTFFYTVPDAAMRPHQVWRHTLGTPATDDVCVYEEADEAFNVHVGLTRSQEWVLVTTGSLVSSETWLVPAGEPGAAPRLVAARRPDVEYHLEHQGNRFLVVTNEGATNFRLLEVPVDDFSPARWHELVPGRDDVKLDAVDAFARFHVVYERADALSRITVVGEDTTPTTLHVDEPVYELGAGTNLEYDTATLRFTYTSLTTPFTVYDEHVGTAQRDLVKRQPVLGDFEPEDYVSAREWAVAPDGTRVPLSIVRHRSTPVDGTAPCVVYGYGSYEVSTPPYFSIARLSLLDRGVVFAIAHVRGGGEMGRRWYEDGKMAQKANSFTDLIAAAEHLMATGFAAPGRIAIRGGSAGGLLVGAATAMRPDLFTAVVAEVPFVDVVNTLLDASLPLTVAEWEEWGNPADPEQYRWLRAYAPYENVDPVPYPAMYVTAGLNDPRVQYWEPAKWVAKLRAVTTGDRPVLLRTELGAGHGGPSGRYDAWRDEARVIAFLLTALGVRDGTTP